MKFSDLFSGFGRDRTPVVKESERGSGAAVAEPGPLPAAVSAVANAPVAGPASAAVGGPDPVAAKAPKSVEEIADLLGTINSVLTSESRNAVRIPCAALLAILPAPLRGPAYREDAFPNANLRLDRVELLEQLKTGRVSYRLGDLYHDIPAGWVAQEKDAVVPLDLAQVVAAIPPALFQITARKDPALQELVEGRDLFMPKRAFVPEPETTPTPEPGPEPEAEPAIQAVAETASAVAPPPPPVAAPEIREPEPAPERSPAAVVVVEPAATAAVPPAVPEAEPAGLAPAASVAEPAPLAGQVPAAATGSDALAEKTPHSVEEIADLLGTIDSVLATGSRNAVRIPGAALLSLLPAELRGPAYRDNAFPNANLRLDRTELLEQLKTGRVSYRLGDLDHDIPAGWVAQEKDAVVSLDLAQVVAALPPALFQMTARQDPGLQALAGGRDLFTPKRAFVPKPEVAATPEPAPVPEAEPVAVAAAEVVLAPELVPPPVAALEETVPEPAPAAVAVELPAAGVGVEAAVPPEPAVVPTPDAAAPEPALAGMVQEAAAVTALPPETIAVPSETALEEEPCVPEVAPVAEAFAPEEPFLADEKRPARIVVPRDVQPVGWDGIEHSLADAAAGVDINTAPAAALEALPGVGPSRAADIVAYRKAHGKFANIYELAKVPGIGVTLFRQMTGLSLVNSTARHEVLNRLLELEGTRNYPLAEMLTRLATRLGVQGCVLAGEYGMPLARTADVGDVAENYAATATQLFRRSQRYLRNLVGDVVECLHLPLAKPELFLFAAENFTLVLVVGRKRLTQVELRKTVAVVRELAWLLGRRAVVTDIS